MLSVCVYVYVYVCVNYVRVFGLVCVFNTCIRLSENVYAHVHVYVYVMCECD